MKWACYAALPILTALCVALVLVPDQLDARDLVNGPAGVVEETPMTIRISEPLRSLSSGDGVEVLKLGSDERLIIDFANAKFTGPSMVASVLELRAAGENEGAAFLTEFRGQQGNAYLNQETSLVVQPGGSLRVRLHAPREDGSYELYLSGRRQKLKR